MTTHTAHRNTGARRLAGLARRVILHLFVLAVVTTGVGAMGYALHVDGLAPVRAVATPVPAPTVLDDGHAAHGLFHPDATLDMSQIDDLRGTDESLCIATDGVMTPAGTCVDATVVWEDEIHPRTWADLRAAGYPRDIDHSDAAATALRVPAEMVILGGENGEDVIAIAMNRQLTPRLIG